MVTPSGPSRDQLGPGTLCFSGPLSKLRIILAIKLAKL